MASWAHPNPITKLHLNWYDHICRAHGHDQETNTQTTLHTYIQQPASMQVIWVKNGVRSVADNSRYRLLTLLSPVMTMTRMPAMRQFLIASITSTRGGSSIPTTPTNVQFVYSKQFLLQNADVVLTLSVQHTHTHKQPFYCSAGICPGLSG